MYRHPFYCLSSSNLIFVDVLLDKKKELLDMMLKHGIIDGLCEVFSTCQDEDTLVLMNSSIF